MGDLVQPDARLHGHGVFCSCGLLRRRRLHRGLDLQALSPPGPGGARRGALCGSCRRPCHRPRGAAGGPTLFLASHARNLAAALLDRFLVVRLHRRRQRHLDHPARPAERLHNALLLHSGGGWRLLVADVHPGPLALWCGSLVHPRKQAARSGDRHQREGVRARHLHHRRSLRRGCGRPLRHVPAAGLPGDAVLDGQRTAGRGFPARGHLDFPRAGHRRLDLCGAGQHHLKAVPLSVRHHPRRHRAGGRPGRARRRLGRALGVPTPAGTFSSRRRGGEAAGGKWRRGDPNVRCTQGARQ